MTDIRSRWSDFWQARNILSANVAAAYVNLASHYEEKHRAYHDLMHIEFCLARFDEYRDLAEASDSVMIAIYYHDVIYDTHRSDNEEASVVFAREELLNFGVRAVFIDEVSDLIRATKHNFVLRDRSQQLIADIDLSGFGQPWPEVEVNSRKIRFEYSWVPEDEYVANRGKILQWFLSREQGLYYLPEFKSKYDTIARNNIAHELTHLRGLARLPD